MKAIYLPRCGHTGEKVRVLLEDKQGKTHERDLCLSCVGKFFGIVRASFEQEKSLENQIRFDL